jgi:hypothetical protein
MAGIHIFNPTDALAFLFCGGLIAGIGWLLFNASKKAEHVEATKASEASNE